MKQSVLVIGHADADGHLITEQVRRNLSLLNCFDVKAIVDPNRTQDHKVWNRLDGLTEIEDADIVFFVDLMFAPMSFDAEAQALVSFVNRHDGKRFFLLDHHPLPLRHLSAADNLRVIYRPDVFECAIGPRSGMMVVAALCERQAPKVSDITKPIHKDLAVAMRRAAALGDVLPGERLLTLLQFDCWSALAELAGEDSSLHYLPRGRRPLNRPRSEALKQLDETAEELMSGFARAPQSHRHSGEAENMSYDVGIAQEKFTIESGRRTRVRNEHAHSRDLETIVTALEVAALSLTTSPGATFTRDRLISEARDLVGDNIELHEEDIGIVLKKQSFLKRSGKKLCLR